MMIQEKGKLNASSIITWTILIFVLIFTIAPLLFTLTSSFMTRTQILRMPYSWIPETFNVDNYIKAIKEMMDSGCLHVIFLTLLL